LRTGHRRGASLDVPARLPSGYHLEGEAVVKKIVVAAAAVAASVLALIKIKGSKSEQKLWAEATDSVPPSSPPAPPSEG
jgi:hypothetical protein